MNGKTCWTETFTSTQGSKQCGSSNNNWFEDSRTVKCEAESVSGKLAVRVYTSLSSNADDESFAIDNVVVSPTGTVFRSVIRYHYELSGMLHRFCC